MDLSISAGKNNVCLFKSLFWDNSKLTVSLDLQRILVYPSTVSP